MRREKFKPGTRFRYIIRDPAARPGVRQQINETISGERYAIVYSYGYFTAYGATGRGVDSAQHQVPDVSMEFLRKIWDEGFMAGIADRMANIPAPTSGVRAFLDV